MGLIRAQNTASPTHQGRQSALSQGSARGWKTFTFLKTFYTLAHRTHPTPPSDATGDVNDTRLQPGTCLLASAWVSLFALLFAPGMSGLRGSVSWVRATCEDPRGKAPGHQWGGNWLRGAWSTWAPARWCHLRGFFGPLQPDGPPHPSGTFSQWARGHMPAGQQLALVLPPIVPQLPSIPRPWTGTSQCGPDPLREQAGKGRPLGLPYRGQETSP